MIAPGSLEAQWPDAAGYLLNHSVGLPPRNARAALAEGLFGPWTARDDQVWPHWLSAVERFRRLLAQVIKGDAASVCPQPSVTSALSQILGALPVRGGRNRLLIAERAFPSLGFLLQMAQRRGFEPVMLPREANSLDPAAWAPYIDDRVHLAVFTHVHSNSGECHDIRPLAELARHHGAISVVDVAQSIGIRPVDVQRWEADFLIGSCIKWLCGGSGAAFLWVHPGRLPDCEPIDVGWFSHADPFEFDIHHFEYASDALRFWGGTPSVTPALVAGNALAALLDVGLEAIESHNRELGDLLCDSVPSHCLACPREGAFRGGSVILQFGRRQNEVLGRMRDAAIQCDARREGLRLSPHFYNTRRDIERVLECL